MLEGYCKGVQLRMAKAGFSWLSLITTLLPVLIEAIQQCFNKPSDLQAFAEGKRGPLQMAGLRLRCSQIVRQHGVRGILRVSAAAGELQAAMLAELDETAAQDAGPGPWKEAFDEAMSS